MKVLRSVRKLKVNRLLVSFLIAGSLLGSGASALPEGGAVQAGSASISASGHNMTIQQLTERAIINWQGFSISSGELVKFLQPSQTSTVLNRVTGLDASLINGLLQGNGRIFLLNPNGVLIGPNGSVNAGSFLATTLNTSDSEFLAGRMTFKPIVGKDLAAVVNHGVIKADGGFVVLLAPSVGTDGVILARGGEVKLGAAKQGTVNFDGQGLINFAINSGSSLGSGTIAMSRSGAGGVLSQAVQDFGIEEAGTLYAGGTIAASKVNMQAAGDATLAPQVTRESDITEVDVTGSLDATSQVALDGHSVILKAGQDIKFDTLVAEPLNGQGGLVSLDAGGSILMNQDGEGIAADSVKLSADRGDINTLVAANSVSALAPSGNILLDIRPGLIDSDHLGSVSGSAAYWGEQYELQGGTLVGHLGTVIAARAGGNVDIDSVNTLYVDQIAGKEVSVSSQTGSIVNAQDRGSADARAIIASENAHLTAEGFLGTVDSPLGVDVGGDLTVEARTQIDGISGVLVGRVVGEYSQTHSTAGLVLLNSSSLQDLVRAQHGLADSNFIGDNNLTGASTSDLFMANLVYSLDEDAWLKILRRTVVWEDSADEVGEDDL